MPAAATARLLLLGGGCDVELKENHIAVFHDVFFAFHAECRARSSLLSASRPRKHAHMYTRARVRAHIRRAKRHGISRLFGTCRLGSAVGVASYARRGLLWSLCMLRTAYVARMAFALPVLAGRLDRRLVLQLA